MTTPPASCGARMTRPSVQTRSRWPSDGESPHGLCNGRQLARHAVPLPAVERAAAGPGRPPTPLLEEERDARGDALIADVADPVRLRRPVPGAALATDDDPVDATQAEIRQRPEE